MNNVIAMYHYVQNSLGLRGLSRQDFLNHILLLRSRYSIVSLTEALAEGNSSDVCVLSFDDGLRDAVSTVLPILSTLKIPAVFFVPSGILREEKILHVQKRHLLLSSLGTEKVVEELNKRLPKELEIRADPACKADYLDDPLTCSLKWMLDYLDQDIMKPVLDDVFGKYFGNEKQIFEDMYLSEADLVLLLSEGMEIGVHGHSHRQLGFLSYFDQDKEIRTAGEIMRPLIGKRPLFMSYPSGSYSPLTIRLLEKYGYDAAVTINKHRNDSETSRFELGRYDCVDITAPWA
jgi:peptidoglycan/xylan/chitin deacetylase (PgdA/CDA1 family)